jgi:hypothetical protein
MMDKRERVFSSKKSSQPFAPRPNTTTPHTLEDTRDRVTGILPSRGLPNDLVAAAPEQVQDSNKSPSPLNLPNQTPNPELVRNQRPIDPRVDSNQNQSSRVNISSGDQSSRVNIPSPQPRYDIRSPPITDPSYDKHTNKDDHLNTSTFKNLSSTSSYPGSIRSYQREISSLHKRGVQGGIMGSTERYFKAKFCFY